MRPRLVVVPHVGSKDALQVSSAEDEGPVQALGPDGVHPPFAEGVRGSDQVRISIAPPRERPGGDRRASSAVFLVVLALALVVRTSAVRLEQPDQSLRPFRAAGET